LTRPRELSTPPTCRVVQPTVESIMPGMTLPLPHRLDGPNLCAFAQSVLSTCSDHLPNGLIIDFRKLDFIEPVGVTFLSNLVDWLHSRNVDVAFLNHDRETPALCFLDDALFFEQILGSKLRSSASPRSTTRPLQHITHEYSHSWLRANLVPWLAGKLGVTNASLYGFQVCVSEIFNNIKDHTHLDIGSIFVQQFPNLDRVNISVADFGRGIPDAVRASKPALNDAQAIVQAVEGGFTTKSTPRNRGAGLDYLLQTVVAGNGGNVTIFSLSGHVLFYPRGTGIGAQAYPSRGFCPGTTIDISLRTDTIVQLGDEPEELEW
jgi:anti-sigma regulatory factor (Ser/Thr protein kinase)/anti-anti-sigma regulatory factor